MPLGGTIPTIFLGAAWIVVCSVPCVCLTMPHPFSTQTFNENCSKCCHSTEHLALWRAGWVLAAPGCPGTSGTRGGGLRLPAAKFFGFEPSPVTGKKIVIIIKKAHVQQKEVGVVYVVILASCQGERFGDLGTIGTLFIERPSGFCVFDVGGKKKKSHGRKRPSVGPQIHRVFLQISKSKM